MREASVGRFEPERAGAERLRDLRRGLGPDEAVLGRVARTDRNRSDVVRLAPQLHLRPDRLHGGRDDGILLRLQHVGDRLRQLGRLPVQQVQLGARLFDLRLEVFHRPLLLRLKHAQLLELRVELLALLDLLFARGLLLLALGFDLAAVTPEQSFDPRRARPRHVEVGDARQQVAQALRLGKHHQHGGWLRVDGSRQLAQLRTLRDDPLREKCLTPLGGRDLLVKVGDFRFDLRDLGANVGLLSRVLLQGLLDLLLRGHRVGQVASQLRADLVDQHFLLVGSHVGADRTGAKHQHCKPERDQESLHDSRCFRRLTSDDPEPSPSPVAKTIAAAKAATVTLTPGANCVNEECPAEIAAIVSPNTTRPATAPDRAPVIAPSTTNGPRTIQRGAPTSCMIVTSSRREWIAARMLLMVTVTATNPSSVRNAMPAIATPSKTAWIR